MPKTVSALTLVDPIYIIPIIAFAIILFGCACYGCYDLFNARNADAISQMGASGMIIACDISDCPIPEIHEQHKIEDKGGGGFWSKKAWGFDSAENSTANNAPGDYYSTMMMPGTSLPENTRISDHQQKPPTDVEAGPSTDIVGDPSYSSSSSSSGGSQGQGPNGDGGENNMRDAIASE